MSIDLFAVEKGGKHTIAHDLNFAKPRYEAKHVITFKNPNPALLEVLRRSGPVPEDANGSRKKDADKKKRKTAQVDMDKLAEGLTRLQEDDLLQVIQMIHDNKSEETYTKNDVDRKNPFRTSRCTSGAVCKRARSQRVPSESAGRQGSVGRTPGFSLVVRGKSGSPTKGSPTKAENEAKPALPLRSWPPKEKKERPRYFEQNTETDNDDADGEFHVDLYTLPDPLVRMLWEYVQSKQ